MKQKHTIYSLLLGFTLCVSGFFALSTAMAKPLARPNDKPLLQFFPSKPLMVAYSQSIMQIIDDIELLVRVAGLGDQLQQVRIKGLSELRKQLGSKEPMITWQDALNAIGLPGHLPVAVALTEIPVPPGLGAIVAIPISDGNSLLSFITKILPEAAGPIAKRPFGEIAQIYKIQEVEFAIVQDRYIVWTSHPSLLKTAITQYTNKVRHFLVEGFRQNLSADARFKVYIDYPSYIKYMTQISQMMDKSNPLTNMPEYQKVQNWALSMLKDYKDMWIEGIANPPMLYNVNFKVTTAKSDSPVIKMIMDTQPTQLRSLELLPKDTVAFFSMNLIQFYFKFAELMLKQLGQGAIFAMVSPWQAMFGQELTLAVTSSQQAPIGGMLMIETTQPKQLQQQLSQLLAMFSGDKPLFQTKTYRDTEIFYFFQTRDSAEGPLDKLPPGALAWAFVGNYLVISYQMSQKPSLAILEQMINPSLRKKNSMMIDLAIQNLMKRVLPSNMILYLATNRILNVVQSMIPIPPDARPVMEILKPMRYMITYARNIAEQGLHLGSLELGFSPPTPAPVTAPPSKLKPKTPFPIVP